MLMADFHSIQKKTKQQISVGSLLLNNLDRRTESTSLPASKHTDAVPLKGKLYSMKISAVGKDTQRVTHKHTQGEQWRGFDLH